MVLFSNFQIIFIIYSEFSVAEGQSVFSLNYNTTSDKFIASTADAKPVVYDKNGNKIVRFIKGDPYVLDNSKTPGHTNTVTATSWHPTKDDLVLSASLDGTCRIWDLNGKRSFDELQSLQVIRAKNKKGIKVGITSASYNTTGNQIFLGCNEGGLLIYDIRNKYIESFLNKSIDFQDLFHLILLFMKMLFHIYKFIQQDNYSLPAGKIILYVYGMLAI